MTKKNKNNPKRVVGKELKKIPLKELIKKEKEIQKEIMEWLNNNNVFHYRQNSGVFFINGRMIRAGVTGISDIVGVLNGGVAFYIEVKKYGGKVSENQKSFLERAKNAGAITVVAYCLDDVKKVFNKYCI